MVASKESSSRRIETLEDARELIRATRVSEKTAGFSWLKRYFEQHRHDPALRNLGQYAIQVLYDDLFQVNADERRMYVRESSSKIQKASAAIRLQEGTGALRALVNGTIKFINKKQASSIINHIMQFLPVPTGGYLPPIAVEYLRILRNVLEYEPHVEHLLKTAKKNQWKDIADFCVDGLQENLNLSKAASPQQARSQRGLISSTSNELLGCLRALTAASNAPLASCGDVILRLVLEILREATSQSSVSIVEGFTSGIAVVRTTLASYSLSKGGVVLEVLPDVLITSSRLFTSATKVRALREEILMMLIVLRPHLESMTSRDASEDLLEAVNLICGALTQNHTAENISSKQRLDLDDLDLCLQERPPPDIMPMQCASFWLRTCSRDIEASWSQLSLSAFYHTWLDGETSKTNQVGSVGKVQAISMADDADDHEGKSRAKRRRVETHLEALVSRSVQGNSATERMRTLQVVAFFIELRTFPESQMCDLAGQLLDLASDKDVLVASWTLLCLCNLASQDLASCQTLKAIWRQVAHLAMQKISSPYHCRIGCHTMTVLLSTELVTYSDLNDSISLAISSASLNGPAVFCDTAVELWLKMSSLRALYQPGTQGMIGYRNMLEWISAKWNPSDSGDVIKISQALRSDLHAKISQALRWTLLDSEAVVSRVMFPRLERVGQCWLEMHMHSKVTRYILLLEESSVSPRTPVNLRLPSDSRPSTQTRMQLRTTIISYLEHEVERIQASWQAATTISLRTHRNDALMIMFSYCVLGISLKCALGGAGEQRLERCMRTLTDMARLMLAYIAGPNGDEALREGAVHLLVTLLPDVSDIVLSAAVSPATENLLQLSEMFIEHMQVFDPSQRTLANTAVDVMDDIFGDDSQRSRHDEDVNEDISRSYCQALSSANSAYLSSLYYIVLQHSLIQEGRVPAQPKLFPSALITHLTSLAPHRLIGCWPLVAKLAHAGWLLRPEDTEGFLNHFATSFMVVENEDDSEHSSGSRQRQNNTDSIYNWDRCESAIGLCLDIMSSSISNWTAAKSPSNVIGESTYVWLCNLTAAQSQVSNVIKVRFVNLLYEMWLKSPQYAMNSSDLPSVRTTLLTLLKDGNIEVKFSVAESLTSFFTPFGAGQHETILEDIREVLPSDPRWREGIAIRLFVYDRLGSEWKSLLRKCFYGIIETALHVPTAAPQAKACLRHITRSLDLSEPRELLRLFRSQILFTWLDSHSVDMLPWTIFHFSCIDEMFEDLRSDIISILLTRGTQHSADEKLASFLSLSSSSLDANVRRSFARVTAYAFIQDIAAPKNPDGTANNDAETRVRASLASAEYVQLLRTQHHLVLGHILLRLDREENIAKYLQKRMASAHAAINEMTTLYSSSEELPTPQQPLIKAKFLPVLIERLQSRLAKVGISNIWSAQQVCAILRMLLDNINPVLGDSHTIRIVRRIRILVSLCGAIVLKEYPLEQLLHGLRPLLTIVGHNQDAIGVFQYLLDKGRPYLESRPAFFAGVITALFLELQKHGASRTSAVDATEGTRSLRSLHQWLAQYLDVYEPKGLDKRSLDLFKRISEAARRIHEAPNARPGTPESALLLALLDDSEQTPFLMLRARSTVIKLFCAQFRAPLTFRDDILGNDAQASKYAARLWKVAEYAEKHEDFHAWTARVLARAFSHSGHIPKNLVDESNYKKLRALAVASPGIGPSKIALLSSLTDLLGSNKSQVIGLAEGAIQSCLVGYTDDIELKVIQDHLPQSAVETFSIKQVHEGLTNPSEMLVLLVRADEHVASAAEPLETLEALFRLPATRSSKDWMRSIVSTLIAGAQAELLLDVIRPLLQAASGLAARVFPFVLHIALQQDIARGSTLRKQLSRLFRDSMTNFTDLPIGYVTAMINAVLYLRTQHLPDEHTIFDRNSWLDLDYQALAQAAVNCNMHKTALMLVEVAHTQQELINGHNRKPLSKPEDTLLSIYKALDEPDSFYGVHKADSVASLGDRLAYEGNSIQSLLFRGAQLDGLYRNSVTESRTWRNELVTSMTSANLNTIVHDLMSIGKTGSENTSATRSLTTAALQLGRWDVAVSSTVVEPGAVFYRTLQGIAMGQDIHDMRRIANVGLLQITAELRKSTVLASSISTAMVALASVNELDQILSLKGSEQLKEVSSIMKRREGWMDTGRSQDVLGLLKARKAVLRIVVRNQALQKALQVQSSEVGIAEIDTIIRASTISRKLGLLEDSLADVTFLSELTNHNVQQNFRVDGAVKFETSNALYDRGELNSSISILRNLDETCRYDQQHLAISRSDVAATLGYRVSVARLEKPVELVAGYFEVAIQDFQKGKEHTEAGNALHIYATFCHDQLANPELLQEIHRSAKFREAKMAEVQEWQIAHNDRPNSESTAHALGRQRKWLEIASEEYTRLLTMREDFIKKSLNCYLDCLAVTDEYDTNAIRFTALWFEHSDNESATREISDRIARVPSRKFAPLMHQLASKLQETGDAFQKILTMLVERISTEHPYHGMYHVYSSKQSSGGQDVKTQSRRAAASAIAARLARGPNTQKYWSKIQTANDLFNELAKTMTDPRNQAIREGQKIKMESLTWSRRIARTVPGLDLPPITSSVPLRADQDYSSTPSVNGYAAEVSILGGISKPKLLAMRLSDGATHKELFKSGSDDMRQDSIMEQVFVKVSSLLQKAKATQQRDLTIRTYNVVPLDAGSGAIEFVQNTTSLLHYLQPAHQRYHPDEWTWKTCRDKSDKVRYANAAARKKVYSDMTSHFSPVFRHFFFEHFDDPVDWFERRLAYTRSTAANSILGWIIGLGDRHNQNILVDTKSGEMIQIDLGVCFEAGRVLPIPELVPFRLTRDLVDGFGILGTEGVFRRCCEFTLEALRDNKETIMTLLNVLRYDPLHNWSVSPLRARRLQKEQDTADVTPVPTPAPGKKLTRRSTGANMAAIGSVALNMKAHGKDITDDEISEADRALGAVERKLRKDLSSQATVNELIQQATDETNLALLFGGWGAWA